MTFGRISELSGYFRVFTIHIYIIKGKVTPVLACHFSHIFSKPLNPVEWTRMGGIKDQGLLQRYFHRFR